MTTLELIELYGEDHLVVDGRIPLVSQGPFQDEALLYHLSPVDLEGVMRDFKTLTGQVLGSQTLLKTLSGGQRVILGILLALKSSAPKVLVAHVMGSLDSLRTVMIREILDREPPGRIHEVSP